MTREIKQPAMKFLIGFLAGLAITIIPKLSAALNVNAGGIENYFPPNLIIIMVVFSLMLGGVMLIIEYDIPKQPKDTFFAAVAIPGILVGALSTTVGEAETSQLKQREQVLLEQVVADKGKEPADVGFIKRLSESTDSSSYDFSIDIIKSAHAESQIIAPEYNSFKTNRETPRYSIVIKEAQSREEALEQVKILQDKVPTAIAVETDDGYKVLANDKLLDKYNAVQMSLELDKQLNEKTSIIRYK